MPPLPKNGTSRRCSASVTSAYPDPLNILTLLLQGFWLGDLRDLHRPSGGKTFFRRQGLKAFADRDSSDGHPDIVICRNQEQMGAEQVLLPNGDIDVDLRTFVFLPTDIADWNEKLCGQAYEKLAECEATAYAPDFLTGFKTMQVGKRNFLMFLRCYELVPPRFWYNPDHPSRGLIRQATIHPIPSRRPRRGRPKKYDYAPIDDILKELLLIPENGILRIELKGELAGILSLCDAKKRPATSYEERAEQIKMVAGAGNAFNLSAPIVTVPLVEPGSRPRKVA